MNCRICNSANTQRFFEDLNRCNKCGHIFKTDDVDPKVYERYISSAHARVTPEHVINAKYAAETRFNFFQHFAKKGNVLEVGCGHKYFLDELTKNGYPAEGTELSKLMIDQIPYKIHYGTLSELDLKKYDNICAFHVLEHFNDPIKELKWIEQHLADDGAIIMEFPAVILFPNITDYKDLYEHWHVNYFNQRSLNLLLEKCNLTNAFQMNYWNGDTLSDTLVCAIKKNRGTPAIRDNVYRYLRGEKK